MLMATTPLLAYISYMLARRGVVKLFLAAKLEETYLPEIKNYVYITDVLLLDFNPQ